MKNYYGKYYFLHSFEEALCNRMDAESCAAPTCLSTPERWKQYLQNGKKVVILNKFLFKILFPKANITLRLNENDIEVVAYTMYGWPDCRHIC